MKIPYKRKFMTSDAKDVPALQKRREYKFNKLLISKREESETRLAGIHSNII